VSSVTVDALFARLHYDQTQGPSQHAGPEGQWPPGEQAASPPPPPLESPADVQVAQEWLSAERARLEAYTRSQFAALQQQHQALLAKQFRGEEALALRAQELNREMKFLASQSEALQNRARELAQREAALIVHMERLASLEQELVSSASPEAHRALIEQLRAETAQLQAAGAESGANVAALSSGLKQRQQAWEHEHEAFLARQVQMEQRFAALEQAEQALQRRIAELDEVEQLLRNEFEQQERRLAFERQEIDVLRFKLRSQITKLQQGVNEAEEDAVPV
jgi:hypothetical protein